VSSDWEIRESAGKLNDPGKKTGKLQGIPQKEGKSGNFHSIILFLEKKKLRCPFLFFFSRKKQNLFFKKIQQLTKYTS